MNLVTLIVVIASEMVAKSRVAPISTSLSVSLLILIYWYYRKLVKYKAKRYYIGSSWLSLMCQHNFENYR